MPDAKVTAIAADCATRRALRRCSAGARARHSVNNLGIYGRSPAFEITDEEWQAFFEIQRHEPASASPATTPPGMAQRGWGRVRSCRANRRSNIPRR